MPQPASRSDPHRRTRRDHATETAEDYVEAIADAVDEKGCCRVVDLARRFAVSHVTVNRILARLDEAGLVRTQRYRPVVLTAQGAELAAESRRRHRIVFQFLLSLGIDPRTAAIDAEGMEHHVSPQTLARFEELTHPQRIPETGGANHKG